MPPLTPIGVELSKMDLETMTLLDPSSTVRVSVIFLGVVGKSVTVTSPVLLFTEA